jgi:hypothetical protein
VTGRELPRGKLLYTLNSPAILFADHAAPCRQALGRMVLHPLGELRRAHQAGLHRDVGEVRSGDGLLVAICRGGETAEHGDDSDHESAPSVRWTLAPLTVRPTDPLSCSSLAGSAGGKMLSYAARAARIRRARSRSDFEINRITSPISVPNISQSKARLLDDDNHPIPMWCSSGNLEALQMVTT